MIRKRAAIFFVFLANIVLLVHAVVPHHHHKSLVCIESSHCQNDQVAHHNCSTATDHEHDGSAGTENCVLRQVVVIPVNSVRHELKCTGCDYHHHSFIPFQTVLFSNEFNASVPEIFSLTQAPIQTSSHSNFVTSSLGLRAPPVA